MSQEKARSVSPETFASFVEGWECYDRHDFTDRAAALTAAGVSE